MQTRVFSNAPIVYDLVEGYHLYLPYTFSEVTDGSISSTLSLSIGGIVKHLSSTQTVRLFHHASTEERLTTNNSVVTDVTAFSFFAPRYCINDVLGYCRWLLYSHCTRQARLELYPNRKYPMRNNRANSGGRFLDRSAGKMFDCVLYSTPSPLWRIAGVCRDLIGLMFFLLHNSHLPQSASVTDLVCYTLFSSL